LSSGIDEETFAQYRTAEIKHGRVAQLAVVGYIIPEVYRFPGEIAPGVSFASIPNGLAALEGVPTLGWIQMFFLIGYIDWRLTTGKSIYPFGLDSQVNRGFDSDETEVKVKTQELQNGRLAMLAILELLRHDAQSLVGGMYAGDEVMGNLITGLPFLYK
jgi:hypothetical protein